MAVQKATELDPEKLRDRAAKARLQAACARTGQERQHLEGMASYWEELLSEYSEAAAMAAAA